MDWLAYRAHTHDFPPTAKGPIDRHITSMPPRLVLLRLNELQRKPSLSGWNFCQNRGRASPLGSLYGRSPARTWRPTRADRCARLRPTVLLPDHPLRSIRRSQGRGASRPIALHTCQLLDSTIIYPCMSAVRSRRPAASAFASESHLRSPGGISGPAGRPARGTRASSRGS